MRMILCPLASGSSGNAVFVSMGETRLLVDAGISAMRVRAALASIGVPAESLSAILVTHEHIDHVKGLSVLARRSGVPVYANAGTWQGILARDGGVPEALRRVFVTGEDFFVDGVNVLPFAIPHDAADPVGYAFTRGAGRLGVATDLGHLSEDWLRCLYGCQGVVLEANHDPDLLENGPYPQHLKRRIRSRKGHLPNGDSAKALAALSACGTQAVFLAHLSRENNLPEIAFAAAAEQLRRAGRTVGEDFWLGVARADGVSDLLALDV